MAHPRAAGRPATGEATAGVTSPVPARRSRHPPVGHPPVRHPIDVQAAGPTSASEGWRRNRSSARCRVGPMLPTGRRTNLLTVR